MADRIALQVLSLLMTVKALNRPILVAVVLLEAH